jgi:glyoxylase-like metal-dependent hydrolase (beta-lactamase superfamily II)
MASLGRCGIVLCLPGQCSAPADTTVAYREPDIFGDDLSKALLLTGARKISDVNRGHVLTDVRAAGRQALENDDEDEIAASDFSSPCKLGTDRLHPRPFRPHRRRASLQEAGATVVAHRNALEPIMGEKLPTAVPDKIFDKEMTIELGGETVKLHHIAPSHSNSMVLVLFPRHRALQCTDVCEAKTLPFMDFLDFYYDGWIQTLDWVLAQDVDFIDVGHYTLATKEDQQALRDYMIDLHTQVLALVRQGQTWDQVWRNVKFKEEYQQWFGYAFMRVPNIQGMYRWVTNHRRGLW